MSKILVIGDVMLDKFSYGDVKRLNPEAPAPLIHIEREEHRLGGAANVAANVTSLTGEVDLIGVIGKDNNGDIFSDLCQKNGINLYSLTNKFPTITKQRFIESTYRQQLLRVDYEEKVELDAKHRQEMQKIIEKIKPEFIVISDYNKGTIDEGIIAELKTIAQKLSIKILVDAKPKNAEFFKDTYLVKPNLREFGEIMHIHVENTDKDIEEYGKIFVKERNTNLVITRGKQGASLIAQTGEVIHLPTQAKDVFDVTGAGDTFMATLTVALARGHNLKQAVVLANQASGIVVGKIGTAVVHREEIAGL